MMGARQWAGQADAHMTLTAECEYTEEPAQTAGHVRTRRTFKWRPAEKDRDGGLNSPRRIAMESEKDARGQLVWHASHGREHVARDHIVFVTEAALHDGDATAMRVRASPDAAGLADGARTTLLPSAMHGPAEERRAA